MSVIASYMVPHPPLIIPEVGRGREKDIQKTIDSYEKIAKDIARIKPETIIISSPHAPLYSDYFYIPDKEILNGNMGDFLAKGVSFEEKQDMELIKEIEEICISNKFPAGGVEAVSLDHGCMIPLYFIRKYLPECKIVVVGLSSLPLIDNYKFGTIIKDAVEKLDRKVVFVASGDLSHKLKEYGPYGYEKEGPIYDEKLMDIMGNAKFDELLKFDEAYLEKVAECGHRSFIIMAGALDKTKLEVEKLSHEDITGVGYGLCMFHSIGEDKNRNFLEEYLNGQKEIIENKKMDPYVKLATYTINNYIKGREIGMPNFLSLEMLKERRGVFVSIHKFGSLRGCIGTIVPTKENVAEEIISNAINASSNDYRFSKITVDELPYLEIKVDVLDIPEEIDSIGELDPKKYGVIVTSGFKTGVLLPDLDGIDTVEEQLKIARDKAGIKESDIQSYQRFKVIRHE